MKINFTGCFYAVRLVHSALPWSTALLFTHAVGIGLCSGLQSETSQIFLLAGKSLDPTLRAVMNQYTPFGPGVRADSRHRELTGTELATDHRGFCARLVHSSVPENIKKFGTTLSQQVCWSNCFIIQSPAEKLWLLLYDTCSSAFQEKAHSSGWGCRQTKQMSQVDFVFVIQVDQGAETVPKWQPCLLREATKELDFKARLSYLRAFLMTS